SGADRNRRASEGLPSSRRHVPTVPRPLRRGVPRGCASRLFTASMAFTPKEWARLSLSHRPKAAAHLTALQASRDATDRSVAPPLAGLSTLRFAAGRFPPATAACYRAPWRLPGPDFHRLATTSLRPGHGPIDPPPDRWAHSKIRCK